MGDMVYIKDENIMGEVVSLMAYGAMVRYTIGGIVHEVFMSDEDYELFLTDLTERGED